MGYIDGMEEKLSQMMDEMKKALSAGTATSDEELPVFAAAPSLRTLWRVKSARPK